MIRERSDPGRPVYEVNGPPFVVTSRRVAAHNRALIDDWFRPQIAGVESILDVHYALHAQHWWALRTYPLESASDCAALASAHMSQYALFSALELLRIGFAGGAGPLFRYVFESQCIAKFARTNPEAPLAVRWMRGEPVYFANGILKRIPARYEEHLSRFWTTLNQEAHATRDSLQASPYAEDNKTRIEADFAVFSMLLAFEFHMLANHTYQGELRQYVRQHEARREIARLLVRARQLHKEAAAVQSPAARNVVRAFAGQWIGASSSA